MVLLGTAFSRIIVNNQLDTVIFGFFRNRSVTENGAGYRIRTRGPLITNQVLYQLS